MGFVNTKMIDPKGIDVSRIANGYADIPGQTVRYVQSSHLRATNLNNQGKNRNYPLSTIVKAISLSQTYDTIIVLPGHIEVVSAANGLDVNKVGLFIHGAGGETTRPQVKVGTLTTATMRISAADVSMDNFDLLTDIDALAQVLSIISAGAKLSNFACVDSATKQALVHLELAVGANFTRISGMRMDAQSAGGVSAIKISGACDHPQILDCDLGGDYSTANIDVTAAATRVRIGNNLCPNLNAANISIKCAAVASSGQVFRNFCSLITGVLDSSVAITMGAGCLWYLNENYGEDTVQQTGKVLGVVAT